MSVAEIELRYFAAVQAALGAEGERMPLPGAATIGDVLARILERAGSAGVEARLPELLGRCSFIVNGRATRDAATPVSAGDTLDVLPPFAGG
ncbi:MoaD/ThiS family protein [Agromyces sp. MMS24-K17]|uniref:MoaD/ThiS family protein n=1 Tax=Agromyces sp. MMS24-K17 TaxID=3372850 RepID=UPI0037544574